MLSYRWASEPESSTTLYFIGQVAIPVGRYTTRVFGQVHQNAVPGTKFAIYDCLVSTAGRVVLQQPQGFTCFSRSTL